MSMDFRLELNAPFTIGKMAWLANRVLVIFEKSFSRMALVDPFCVGKEIIEEVDLKSLDVYAVDVLPHAPMQFVNPMDKNHDLELTRELEKMMLKSTLHDLGDDVSDAGSILSVGEFTPIPQQTEQSAKNSDYAAKVMRIRHESATVYLIGRKGIRAYRLLNWQQRINVMYAAGFYKQAFDTAIEMYLENQVPKIPCIIGLPKNKEQISALLSHHLRLYVSKSLRDRYLDDDADNALLNVGKTCLNYCIEIENYDIIWDLFQKYSEEGKSGVFVELLCKYAILPGKLQSCNISTNLYDAIEDYHIRSNKIDTLENVILNLDIRDYEFERLKNMCVRYRPENQMNRLWLYIFNVLRDSYITPLDDLMDAITASADQNQLEGNAAKIVGNAVMEYLKNCFNGRSFTNAFKIPADVVKKVKQDLITYIFQDRNQNLGGSKNYKYVETLIQFNASDFFEILSITFNDSGLSAPFDDQEDVSAKSNTESILNRQNITSILITIMNNQKWKREQVSHFYTFIIRYMVKGYTPKVEIFMKIFKHLVTDKSDVSAELSRERQSLLQEILVLNPDQKWINDQVIRSVEENKMFQLAAYLYKQVANYTKVITCYLADPRLVSEVYSYLKELSTSDEIQFVRQAILENLRPLMSKDPERMSQLLATCHSELHSEVYSLLKERKDEQLLYQYLKYIISYSQTSSTIPITDDMQTTYVLLLCQFDKLQVPNYLTTFQTNDLSAILRACEKYEIPEAVSFLYEKV
jgi:hypothetical protein